MSHILCITESTLCREDFGVRLERLAEARPLGIILREKVSRTRGLSDEKYLDLAEKASIVCQKFQVPLILHDCPSLLQNQLSEKKFPFLHLPLPSLLQLEQEDPEKHRWERPNFASLGASCHSLEDGLLAERMGCTAVIAGHIFDTDCKKGLPGRGLSFLQEICSSLSIPVYAIGGITPENAASVREAGAAGACIMSSAMRDPDPQGLIRALDKAWNDQA